MGSLMARCPFAVQKILPENQTQTPIKPRAIIMHTAVDSATPNSSIHGYFARGDIGVESHFYVMDNGSIEQYMDTEVRADANADANAFAISIETEDDGNPTQNKWTTAQLDSLVKLVDWLCTTHGVPRKQIDTWDGAGIGWHAMWGAPSRWTPAVGKTCPGGPRIWQTVNELIPRVAARGRTEGYDMASLDELKQLIVGYGTRTERIDEGTHGGWGYGRRIEDTQGRVISLEKAVARLEAAQATPVPVEIDYDRIINGVAAKLHMLQFRADAA